jgi:hypothetical protein
MPSLHSSVGSQARMGGAWGEHLSLSATWPNYQLANRLRAQISLVLFGRWQKLMRDGVLLLFARVLSLCTSIGKPLHVGRDSG